MQTSERQVRANYRRFALGALRLYLARRIAKYSGFGARKDPVEGRLDIFARKHLRDFLRLAPIEQVTVTDYLKDEGAGSRALMTMFVIAFCRAYGVPYVHTPFAGLAHAERGQQQWDSEWEEFFNLGEGETAIDEARKPAWDFYQLSHIKLADGNDLTSLIQPPLARPRPAYYLELDSLDHPQLAGFYEQEFVQLIAGQTAEFRARYRKGKEPPASGPLRLAMHIRRGDVTAERQDMWTELASFAATLDSLCAGLEAAGLDYRVDIFSQGQEEEFAELARPGVTFHLDADPLWSLQQIIEADVLVTSKSCYSYVGGILAEAIVLHERSRFPAMPGWITRDPQGAFDTEEFAGRLQARAEASAPRP